MIRSYETLEPADPAVSTGGHFIYEVIPWRHKAVCQIVSGLLNRKDIDTIYVCTDSGREGEYIYRLVEQMAGVKGKTRKRVWIDSQTEEEILRGIRDGKGSVVLMTIWQRLPIFGQKKII